jgi:hypothetical protein
MELAGFDRRDVFKSMLATDGLASTAKHRYSDQRLTCLMLLRWITYFLGLKAEQMRQRISSHAAFNATAVELICQL